MRSNDWAQGNLSHETSGKPAKSRTNHVGGNNVRGDRSCVSERQTDSEAMIKHRVALDGLWDRNNLNAVIPVKYDDTQNQRVAILTKGSFTRNRCDRLLRLFNIMDVSVFSCDVDEIMSKRQVQGKEEGEEPSRMVAKSRLVRNLTALSRTSRSAQEKEYLSSATLCTRKPVAL